ncbi:dipeptide epimerase [Rubrobacter naiadicus]|uniref:dipeptide epimerase n=1 Tax=Rubrobacter naiadicus TaxID=1392641 RepID=UPI002360272D|nr:dipeptide epimerase [Rubrobacter naiadicus]
MTVHTSETFAIARGSSDTFRRAVVQVEEDGLMGLGEAASTGYYGQDPDTDRAALESVRIEDPWDIEGTLRLNEDLSASALAALDAALHDLAAKRLGIPVWRLLGLSRPRPASAYTLAIADRETTLSRARSRAGYPIFKVKLGGWRDIETLRALSGETEAEIWADANEAFAPEEAVEAVRELREIGVAMIEQPVAASEGREALEEVTRAASPVPVIADESALVAADVPPLVGCVSGVNVKLAKCGGIRRALEMIHTARACGMRVMVGCMVETSLGISAAAQFSGLVDYVDLDGPMLLADDPFEGLVFERGRLLVPDAPGLGVEFR